MFKKYSKIIIIAFVLMLFFVVHNQALASGPHLVPEAGKDSGNYQLSDFVVVALNVATWILIVSGSLALLAFVVGGLMFILSAGNRELVEKGKNSLIGATIGLVIVLLAFTAIDFFLDKLDYQEGLFGGEWNKLK